MQNIRGAATFCFFAAVLVVAQIWGSEALAQSSYFSSQGCSGCHAAPVVATCNGCHAHGIHPNSAKNAINVAGTTNKSSYAPGEMVTVTITGGYRTGWIRAVLYDQNMVELARSTGNDSGMGSSATYPAVLTAPAPGTPGTYSWKVAWYGNNYEAGGATFGSGWTPDTNNPSHGSEIVSITTPFTVATATLPTPTISSVAPNSLVQGAVNQTVTIAGTNLTGATVNFSNAGVTAGTATVTATSISLPVSVAANAATGAGTVTFTTASGSASSAFNVTAAAIPAPTLSSVTPNSLAQGVVNQSVTIAGASLTGATISFSKAGVSASSATVTATSINLLVSVAANAATGAGTVTVTTASGSASGPFSVSAAAIPAPAISSVIINSLVQGAANQSVTITGANLTGATVSFSNAGVIGGLATVTATSISLPVSVAANAATGAGIVTVTTTGGSASSAFSITPRASAPTLAISALSDGSYTNNVTLNISGSVSAAAGIQSVNVNGQSVTVMTDGSFSTALALVAGANTVTVTATDNAGSQKSDTRAINYDPISPVLTVSALADNSTSTSSFVTVSGSINETSTVAITDNAGSPQSATMNGNNFSATVNLAPGVNTINIVATDLAGNTSSAKRTVTYDTSKLTLAVTNPSQDMTTSRSTLIFMGTVTNSSKEITVTITMAGRTYTHLVTNGIFKQRLTFTAAKLYPITVTAKDAAGNSSSVSRNVIYRPAVKGDDDTSGGTTSHPFGWTDPKSSHPDYVKSNGVASCISCHSIDQASKGQTMSCYNCHGKKWTTPSTGGGSTGGSTSHPFGWTNPKSSHPDYAKSNGVASCVSCHSIDQASKGQTMSCYNCHGKQWTTPSTGGGSTGGSTSHPFGWTNPKSSHPDYVKSNGVASCVSCHSIDQASKGQTMSCYNCHGKQWTTPSTGGGSTGGSTSHPFGWTNPKSSHPDYVKSNGVASCVSCHSIDQASKGQTMSCYNCHGKQWTTPSTGGASTGGGSTGGSTSHPFGWTDPKSSHPDYVKSNGVASCVSCHSIDQASKGQTMSCYNCHGMQWSTPSTSGGSTGGGSTGGTTSHPFGWTNPKSSHPDYVKSNGVASCVSCHSIDQASKGQTMSCYNCHGKQW